MKKFEYKKISRDLVISVEELDELGNKGWELCGISESSCYYDDRTVNLVFKREIGEIDVLKEILKEKNTAPEKPKPPTGTVFTEGSTKPILPDPPKNRISKEDDPNIRKMD